MTYHPLSGAAFPAQPALTGQAAFTAKIEGYASVFNVADENGDIVAPGAFREALQAKTPIRMLYQHDVAQPIGRWERLVEDARGLFVSGEIILRAPRAREAYALIEGGALDGLSIGFRTVKARKEGAGRRILKADLWEVSVVTFPMARLARITKIGPPRPVKTFAAASPTREPAPHASEAALFAEAVRGAAAIMSQ